MKHLTPDSLKSEVLAPQEKPKAVLFWMAGCERCLAAKPSFAALALDAVCDRYLMELKTDEPETLREIARLGMKQWPAIGVYTKRGQPAAAIVGLIEPGSIDSFIRSSIAAASTQKAYSRWEQLRSLSSTAWKVAVGLFRAQNPIAPKGMQEARAAVCEPCYDRKDKSCGVCGCLLKAKQSVRASSCPKGLW